MILSDGGIVVEKLGKVLGILGGIILFYLSISMVSFLLDDVLLGITGILGIVGSVAAVIVNSFVEGKRLKRVLLIGAPCTSFLLLCAVVIPALITGSIKGANEWTFVILGVMLLTLVMLILSALFGLKSKSK
jgi:hypothetical protein